MSKDEAILGLEHLGFLVRQPLERPADLGNPFFRLKKLKWCGPAGVNYWVAHVKGSGCELRWKRRVEERGPFCRYNDLCGKCVVWLARNWQRVELQEALT